jgi:hypothetical protein
MPSCEDTCLQISHREELTYQCWEEEKIVQEQFFYDPAQLTPKPVADSVG